MSDAGEEFEQAKVVIDGVDKASQSVRAACDLLQEAIDGLTPLVPEEPQAANAVATYTAAREVLLAQLDTMDRAKKVLGA